MESWDINRTDTILRRPKTTSKRVLRLLAIAASLAAVVIPAIMRIDSLTSINQLALVIPTITNLNSTASVIGRYERLEITFEIPETSASNLQYPYDSNPPPNIPAGVGISVDGLFSDNGWISTIVQPGFLYQDYVQQTKETNKEWMYSNGNPVWKIRFAPPQLGNWIYKIRIEDGLGMRTSDEYGFTVIESDEHGFVRVSPDKRYFEFSDGTPFVGVGHNEGFPIQSFVSDVDSKFDRFAANRTNFFRVWMSGSSIAGSAWMPWTSHHLDTEGGYLPPVSLSSENAYMGQLFALKLSMQNPCMFYGFNNRLISVKPNTTYRLMARANINLATGGFSVKEAFWLGQQCNQSGNGNILLPQVRQTNGWQELTSTFTTDNKNFLNFLYLALEDTATGTAYIDEVSIKEVLAGGDLGPELLSKGRFNYQSYFDQHASWLWDYALDSASEHGVYLKIPVLEKNDWLYNQINLDGSILPDNAPYDNNRFYAAPGTTVRRLHEYFWRYIQARWGYSTAVHSWELLNEGDPFNGNHYDQADAFANTMPQMATTSFWHSYPANEFLKTASVDYGDIHAYISTGGIQQPGLDRDSALYSKVYGDRYGAFGPSGAGKPVIRGEAGIDYVGGPQEELPGLALDTTGVWLHNYTWAMIAPGGIYELYWWTDNIRNHNLYPVYKSFSSFMQGIPLNSGNYSDAAAETSQPDLRVWGQKDLINGQAHLWIQNQKHTWYNVVNNITIPRLTGTVEISGFAEGDYLIEWWDTYTGSVIRTELISSVEGNILLEVSNLFTDIACKISRSDTIYLPFVGGHQ